MNATNVLERVPIHTDDHGVVRVARSRVTLETIVDAFETGATADTAMTGGAVAPADTGMAGTDTTMGATGTDTAAH